jgi:hypothetical protein
METKKKKCYLNPAQQFVHDISPKSKTLVCARRFGKSDGILGPDMLYDVQHMPGSSGFIYQKSFKQALGRTLPATLAFWKRYNYMRDVHYFIGRKAPKWMNFATPEIEPASYDHCIHVYNGTIIHILSEDVPFSGNSLTTDWGKADEGRSLKKEKFFEEMVPTLSGTHPRFASCHKWRGLTIVSDMPTSKQGQWVLEMEKQMDIELINGIEETLEYIKVLRRKYSSLPVLPNNIEREIVYQYKELNEMRKHAFLYKEFDTIDNIEIVGADYVAEMKRILTPLVFQTSVMNRRITKLVDGFYSSLDPELHYYQGTDANFIDNIRTEKGTLDLDKISNTSNCQKDSDIDQNTPLAIAFDYNSKINWVATAQRIEPYMKTLSSFFTKGGKKLRSLCKEWCDYYDDIPNKDVIYYYNSTALDSGYADEESESFADIIINALELRGWNVTPVFIGKIWPHKLKYQYINDALDGNDYLFPLFNRDNNEYLLPAMEMCGTHMGRTGFEKDKSGEKKEETEGDPYELRTDGTDAWDDLFIGLNFFPQQYTSLNFSTVFLNQ